MSVITDPTAVGPNRFQQIVAWLAAGGIIALVAWGLMSATFAWQSAEAEIAGLRERAGTLQARQEDPAPLLSVAEKMKAVAPASLGYLEGATAEEAKSNLEQVAVGIFGSGQAQINAFQRLPVAQYGPVTGIGFAVGLTTMSVNVLPLLQALEKARPIIVVRSMELDRRQDGSVSVSLRAESFWTPPR